MPFWPFSRQPKKRTSPNLGKKRTPEQQYDREKWLAMRELLRGDPALRKQVGLMALGLTPDDPAEAAAKDAEAAAKTAEAAFIRASKDIGRELALARIEATKRSGTGGQSSPFDDLLKAMQAMRAMREFADENGSGGDSRGGGGETLGAQIGDVLRGLSPVLAAALPLMLGGRMDPNALAALQQGYLGALAAPTYGGGQAQEDDSAADAEEADEEPAVPPQAVVMPVQPVAPSVIATAPVVPELAAPTPVPAQTVAPRPPAATATQPARRPVGRPRKNAAKPAAAAATTPKTPTKSAPARAIPDPLPLEPAAMLALVQLPAPEAAVQAWRILHPALQNQADAKTYQVAWALVNLLLSDESDKSVMTKLGQVTAMSPDLKAWRSVVAALGKDLVWLGTFRHELGTLYDAAAQPQVVAATEPAVAPAQPTPGPAPTPVGANGYVEFERLPTIMR